MARQRAHDLKEHPLDAPLLTFDIPALLTQIKGEETWKKGEHNAMTLVKGKGLRVVLVAMHADTAIAKHQADCPISLQVIEGRIKLSTDSEVLTINKGHLLTLKDGIPHFVEAPEESAFLLTLATDKPHPAEH